MSRAHRYKVLTTDSRLVNRLQSSLVLALLSHWLFQGLLYMDRTERWFKVGLDAVLTILYLAVAGFYWPNLLIAISVAHTLNFLLNGQINVVFKNFGISGANEERLQHYLQGLGNRLQHEPSILYALAFGSLVRSELHDSSDLDIRVVRRTGISSGLRSCAFVLLERARATLNGIPLDVYVLDTEQRLSMMRSDEQPHYLKDMR
jgi:predicted nucleotidyltransferase